MHAVRAAMQCTAQYRRPTESFIQDEQFIRHIYLFHSLTALDECPWQRRIRCFR